MYLSRVRIKNFRSLDDIDVELRKGLTVIVGENNIGKTNVIDAIRFALGPGSTGNTRQWPRQADISRGASVQAFQVDLFFSEVGTEQMADFIECLNYDRENPAASSVEIHYEWSWDERADRYHEKRWGGPAGADTAIPSELLQSIPFVYLEPLRDALGTLLAGRGSRVGNLLRRMKPTDVDAPDRIETIVSQANKGLEGDAFVASVVKTIQKNIDEITSADLSQPVSLATSAQKFDSIVNSLSLMLRIGNGTGDDGAELYEAAEIRENGLGYNNILFIATVLAELSNCEARDVPILCVEEPEAHLHPQLQILLGEYLKRKAETDSGCIQVILTTHSPNLASHLPLTSLNVIHRPSDKKSHVAAAPMWKCGLTFEDEDKLERLIDATKASLFFARGVVLVEGVCEQLLLPGLARQLQYSITGKSISVIPVYGLNYVTVAKLFGKSGLRLKCAIITDGDPKLEVRSVPLLSDFPAKEYWKTFPVLEGLPTAPSPDSSDEDEDEERAMPAETEYVKIFQNRVTLEYDLAAEGENANVMARIWRESMGRRVPRLTPENLARLSNADERATLIWQSVCLVAKGSRKASFAHELARGLFEPDIKFLVPSYIGEALDHVGCVASPGESDGE